MFRIEDPQMLKAELDAFAVPMFAIDRKSRSANFRYVCLNAAHERRSGLRSQDVCGIRPEDLLPANEAGKTLKRCKRCARTGALQCYREELHFNGRSGLWDTTLQFVPLASGGERVIGTSMPVDLDIEGRALSDAEFFTLQARLHSGNLQHVIDQLAARSDLPSDIASCLPMVGGICGALLRVIEDARLSIARSRSAAASAGAPPGRVAHHA